MLFGEDEARTQPDTVGAVHVPMDLRADEDSTSGISADKASKPDHEDSKPDEASKPNPNNLIQSVSSASSVSSKSSVSSSGKRATGFGASSDCTDGAASEAGMTNHDLSKTAEVTGTMGGTNSCWPTWCPCAPPIITSDSGVNIDKGREGGVEMSNQGEAAQTGVQSDSDSRTTVQQVRTVQVARDESEQSRDCNDSSVRGFNALSRELSLTRAEGTRPGHTQHGPPGQSDHESDYESSAGGPDESSVLTSHAGSDRAEEKV